MQKVQLGFFWNVFFLHKQQSYAYIFVSFIYKTKNKRKNENENNCKQSFSSDGWSTISVHTKNNNSMEIFQFEDEFFLVNVFLRRKSITNFRV